MALRGSLTDMGVVDVLQFPHTGKKSGVLIVVNTEDDARLFYENGQLYHAVMGEEKGMDVLTRLVDWDEGEFEFRIGTELADERSIEVDLHRAIMMALKTRDEQNLKAEESKQDKLDTETDALLANLRDFVGTQEYIEYAGILDDDGSAVAEVSPIEQNGSVDALKQLAAQLVKSPPRAGFSRLFLEDEAGTAVVSRCPSRKKIMLVLANQDANLGAVSVALNRMNHACTRGEKDEQHV